MSDPSEIEIAAAYFFAWATNLRSTPTDNEDAHITANVIADGIQQAGDSLLAGAHLKWHAQQQQPSGTPCKPNERPPSGPHGTPREPIIRQPSLLDG